MRVPLEWLKDYVAIRLAPKALAERLTMAGLEVVAIHGAGGETVFDIEVTPNRPDCLSIVGVAREVAAITGQPMIWGRGQGAGGRGQGKSARQKTQKQRTTIHESRFTIRIEDKKGCPRYIGRVITGVAVGPSPEWMQRRLAACGLRPINTLVDITNYVLMETGQPLHAFDADRLAERTIIVRRARPGEPITTLDGIRRALTEDTLVIADARQAVAVAGIMGGLGSEVTHSTTVVLLESAAFDPVTIRRTGRKLGLASDSSYRFERGVDPAGVDAASCRAAALMETLAGGTVAAVAEAGSPPKAREPIALDVSRLKRWLGVSLPASTVRTTLARLGCRVASSGASQTMRVSSPSFRRDLQQEVDLYEELARMIGYDRLPATLPESALPADRAPASGPFWQHQSLRCLCASLGLDEAVTWSMVAEAELVRCGLAQQAAKLANPLSQDQAYLRPSLLPGLLQAVRRNLVQGAPSVRLFEVGHVVEHGAEQVRLGVILSGLWSRDWRAKDPCDFFRLKGVVDAIARRLCQGAVQFAAAARPWTEAAQSTEIRLDGRPVGMAGHVAPAVAAALDIEQGVWFAELSVEALLEAKRSAVAVRAPTSFPPVKRDLSILVSDETAFDVIDRTIRSVAGTLASRVELIDRYTGKQIPPGKSSLTFSIEYRDAARTLTAAEVDTLHQRISQTLAAQLGAQLR